jgi:hypothetical protein
MGRDSVRPEVARRPRRRARGHHGRRKQLGNIVEQRARLRRPAISVYRALYTLARASGSRRSISLPHTVLRCMGATDSSG